MEFINFEYLEDFVEPLLFIIEESEKLDEERRDTVRLTAASMLLHDLPPDLMDKFLNKYKSLRKSVCEIRGEIEEE